MPSLRKRKSEKKADDKNEGAPAKEARIPASSTATKKAGFDFFNSDTIALAKKLLGQVLVSHLSDSSARTTGVIVETEAYPGVIDGASTSFEGRRTTRHEALFHPAGTFCVHYTYGRLSICSISSKETGGGVLIRALQPVDGIATMCKNRTVKGEVTNSTEGKVDRKLVSLCNGPAKLSQAMGITRDNANKVSLVDSDKVYVELSPSSNVEVHECTRVGIESAGEEWRNKLWRFYVKGSKFISRK